MAETAETINQLDEARSLALANPSIYAQVVPGVLPIIGPGAAVELRRWGADFLSETFASPVLPNEQKTALAIETLPLIKAYLETESEDIWVVKAAVQAVACCYPLIFRYIIDHPEATQLWQTVAATKSNILRRMDGSPPGIRICCIKFVQSVVQAQTPGVIKDPRRPDQNDISLALVPRDHPIIPPSNLEAEASGLLDRLLSTIQDAPSDVLLVTATINCLGGLVLTRASIANKILLAVMNVNLLTLVTGPMTVKNRILLRSLERTIRALLVAVLKLNTKHNLAGRIQQFLEHMHRSREEVFNEASRKRSAPGEDEEVNEHKRQKVQPAVQFPWPPPLPPGPTTIANLFSLTQDPNIRNFDVSTIPDIETVAHCVTRMLSLASQERIDKAINAVRARWLSVADPSAQTVLNTPKAPEPPPDEDDDDYEPDWPEGGVDTAGQPQERDVPPAAPLLNTVNLSIGPFKLPEAQQLSAQEIARLEHSTVARVLAKVASSKEGEKKQASGGFNRRAGEKHDRDAWITMLCRLAGRAHVGLAVDNNILRPDTNGGRQLVLNGNQPQNVADQIRESLRDYVVQDFRKRIDVATSWLNEEWYNDRVMSDAYRNELSAGADDFSDSKPEDDPVEPPQHYERWLLRMLDSFLPYLDAKDKVLIRFLSEVPRLNEGVMQRVKRLADDPERVPLAVSSLQYLIMLKPPARQLALNALEDLWRDNPDAKHLAAKILAKWRPHVLQEQPNGAAPPVQGGEVKVAA